MKPSEMPTWMLEYYAPMQCMEKERAELIFRRKLKASQLTLIFLYLLERDL